MRLSAVLYLLRARLRARAVLVQEVFALLGISIGVALLFSSQVAHTSLSQSVTQLDKQLVGEAQFQLDSRSPSGFDEPLLGQIRAVPGVRDAFPLLEQEVSVVGPKGRASVDLIGADPYFARSGRSLRRRLAANPALSLLAVALPSPMAHTIGARERQQIELEVGDRTVGTRLGVTLGEGEIGGAINSPVALAYIHYAQRLTGMQGKLTRIFVGAAPKREHTVGMALSRLARANAINLEPADYDVRLFSTAVAPEGDSERLFSAISALVGFMFALNAMLITVPARRRLIEELQLQGATRSMLAQILLFDAAVTGVLACVIGLALGDLLSIAVFHPTPGYLAFAFPVGNGRIVTWQSASLAIAAGLAAALVGVLWPLHEALQRTPRSANAAASHRRKSTLARLTVGVLCLAVTAVLPAVSDVGEVVGNIVLIVALVCLLSLLFDGSVALFDRVQRPLNTVASALTSIELQTPHTRVRSLAIAVTAAVAVFGAAEFQGIQHNLMNGLKVSAHGIDAGAQVWVSPRGEANALLTTPFEDTYSHTLSRLPGVEAIGLYRGGLLDWGSRRLWVLAPPRSSPQPIPPSQIISGDPTVAARRLRSGGWAVLSRALAGEHHWRLGQAFELPAPRPMVLRVAAISTNLGWPPGTIIMSAADYARAWESQDPSAYEIQATPGTPITTLRSEVRRALGTQAGLVVETSSERDQLHSTQAAQSLSRITQIRLLVLIAAVLAVATTIGAMIWQRRELIAFMKVDGYRQGLLWRWLLCESAILLTIGCSIGAVFGLYGEYLGSHFLANVTGFPIIYNVHVAGTLMSVALVILTAVAVTAIPSYLVARVPPRAVSPAY